MPVVDKIVRSLMKSSRGLLTKRVGTETGIFYGNKVKGRAAQQTILPTRGADVAYFGPVDVAGDASSAPVADAVDFGLISIDQDIKTLAKAFSPQDTTWATDLAGLIALKRSGKEVAHFVGRQDPSAVVSVDLRHVQEDELLKRFVQLLATKEEHVKFGEAFSTETWKDKLSKQRR